MPLQGAIERVHVSTETDSDTPSTVPENVDGKSVRWLLPWIGFFALALIGANVWFARYNFRTMTGDNLSTWVGEHSMNGWWAGVRNAFIGAADSKYRPFAAIILLLGYHAFGSFYAGYKDMNLVIEALNLTLFGYLVWRLSGSRLLAVGLSIVALAATSDLYYVLQTFGAAEGLCLTMMLLFIIAARKALHGSTVGVIASNLAYFGAVYTHERYLGMGPAVMLVPLMASRPGRQWRRDLRWRAGWIAAPVAIVVSNVVVKAILGVHFLTGTGGTNITLSTGQFLTFLSQGAKTLVGFDSGPNYLAGANWSEIPHSEGLIFGACFATVASATLLTASLRQLRYRGAHRWTERIILMRVPVIGIMLSVVMLALACTTINLQYRWLYSPYLVLLLGLAWAVGQWKPGAGSNKQANRSNHYGKHALWLGMIMAIVGAGFMVQIIYRPYAGNTYFFSAQSTADSVYQQIFVDHASELSTTTFLVDTNGSALMQNWILGDGSFFTAYADGRNLDIRIVSSEAAAAQQTHLRRHVVVLVWNGNNAVITNSSSH